MARLVALSTEHPQASRWQRPIALGLALAVLAAAAVVWWIRYGAAADTGVVAFDYRVFVALGRRFLETGQPYATYQLAGPYQVSSVNRPDPATAVVLYPPPFAFVGVALTVLPAVLWWLVPLGLLAYVIAEWRPAPWSWPVMALCLLWPATSAVVIVGGSTMWIVALTAAGLRWHWPAALMFLKPSFIPLALIGIRHRSWWIAVGILGLVSLVMLPLWFDYLAAVRNATDVGFWYSIGDLPLIALPIVAWFARSRTQTTSSSPS